MQLEISFIHLDHTEALDQCIREKSEKLSKLMEGEGDVRLKWTCYVKEKQHCAEIHILGRKMDIFAKDSSPSLYKSIDQALLKVEKQLSKRKSKLKNKIHRRTKIVVQEKSP